jgi:gliding motility-associated-like protein
MYLHSHATHIVGGSFKMTYVSQNIYDLELVLYIDRINGNLSAIDDEITVSFFRKRDNFYIGDITMAKEIQYTLPASNTNCLPDPDISTLYIGYDARVRLTNKDFSDPEGYYISYERCCRNATISNIVNPVNAAQVLYLEFPAIVKNGQTFVNSSPAFADSKNDYACVGKPFVADYSAFDFEGDSLVYSMVTPLNGNTSLGNAVLNGIPGPYQTVNFRNNFNVNNQIIGTPSLNINQKTGQLSVIPSSAGLFVFAVRCEEYRNKVKIGEVRKEYQIYVRNSCQVGTPPVNDIKLTDNTIYNSQKDTIYVEAGTAGQCVKLAVKDVDNNSTFNSFIVPISSNAVNFTLENRPTQVVPANQTVEFDICTNECPDVTDTVYVFDIITADNTCPLPLYDTVRVTVYFLPPPDNIKPNINPLPFVYNDTSEYYETTINYGDSLGFIISGTDGNGDTIKFEAVGIGFNLSSVGMTFSAVESAINAQGTFSWKPICSHLGADLSPKEYLVEFRNYDYWKCGKKTFTSVKVKITVQYIPPPNNLPVIHFTDDYFDVAGKTVTKKVVAGNLIAFNITASDADIQPVTLLTANQNIFTSKGAKLSIRNNTTLLPSAAFEWQTDCSLLNANGQPFSDSLFIYAYDTAVCDYRSYDTLAVHLIIEDTIGTATPIFPNVFTPNQDGKNDTFKITNLPIDNCADSFQKIQIYNRWGQLLFESNERDFEWNGGNAPDGSYLYYISYRNKSYKGTVLILR